MKKLVLIIFCGLGSMYGAFAQNLWDSKPEDPIYLIVNNSPQPRDGYVRYYRKIEKEIRNCLPDLKLDGKLHLSFVVERDSSLSHFEIDKGLDPRYDEVALRVIKEGPKWIPGAHGGKVCRVKVSLVLNRKE
ncbi:MAG: hypothetical protein AAFU64_19585 [Bacteroidota bacterium]